MSPASQLNMWCAMTNKHNLQNVAELIRPDDSQSNRPDASSNDDGAGEEGGSRLHSSMGRHTMGTPSTHPMPDMRVHVRHTLADHPDLVGLNRGSPAISRQDGSITVDRPPSYMKSGSSHGTTSRVSLRDNEDGEQILVNQSDDLNQATQPLMPQYQGIMSEGSTFSLENTRPESQNLGEFVIEDSVSQMEPYSVHSRGGSAKSGRSRSAGGSRIATPLNENNNEEIQEIIDGFASQFASQNASRVQSASSFTKSRSPTIRHVTPDIIVPKEAEIEEPAWGNTEDGSEYNVLNQSGAIPASLRSPSRPSTRPSSGHGHSVPSSPGLNIDIPLPHPPESPHPQRQGSSGVRSGVTTPEAELAQLPKEHPPSVRVPSVNEPSVHEHEPSVHESVHEPTDKVPSEHPQSPAPPSEKAASIKAPSEKARSVKSAKPTKQPSAPQADKAPPAKPRPPGRLAKSQKPDKSYKDPLGITSVSNKTPDGKKTPRTAVQDTPVEPPSVMNLDDLLKPTREEEEKRKREEAEKEAARLADLHAAAAEKAKQLQMEKEREEAISPVRKDLDDINAMEKKVSGMLKETGEDMGEGLTAEELELRAQMLKEKMEEAEALMMEADGAKPAQRTLGKPRSEKKTGKKGGKKGSKGKGKEKSDDESVNLIAQKEALKEQRRLEAEAKTKEAEALKEAVMLKKEQSLANMLKNKRAEKRKLEEERLLKEKIAEKEEEKYRKKQLADRQARDMELEMRALEEQAEEARQAEEEAREALAETRKNSREEREARRQAEIERKKRDAQEKREEARRVKEAARQREQEMLMRMADADTRRKMMEEERYRREMEEEAEAERIEEEERRAMREAEEEEERIAALEKAAEEEAMVRLIREREEAEKRQRLLREEAAKMQEEEEKKRKAFEEEQRRLEVEMRKRELEEQERKEQEKERLLKLKQLEEEAQDKLHQAMEKRRQAAMKRREQNLEQRAHLESVKHGQGMTKPWLFSYYVLWPRETYEKLMGVGDDKKKKKPKPKAKPK
ncbi:unnamed protein product [Owenia fusiformis]|uniref:Uncharacterized protein n=1 Tax=Owenia fusiformis TaxID=6347 RepID=A0A8S4PVS9_OWEFU|nr:unnamed protein product [Owenia fusiformis]